MSIRHLNRNRSKVVPKAWVRCTTRPKYNRAKNRNSKHDKRDKRITDRREAKLNREKALARSFVRTAI